MGNSSNILKIACVTPRVFLADIKKNTEEILKLFKEAAENKADIIVFPEMAITGATCGVLIKERVVKDSVRLAIKEIIEASRDIDATLILGKPSEKGYIIVRKGTILENDERFDVVVGDKIWKAASYHSIRVKGLIINIAAYPEETTGHDSRKFRIAEFCSSFNAAAVHCAAGYGESTSQGVYAGGSFICNKGTILAEATRFQRESSIIYADIDPTLAVYKQPTYLPDTPVAHPFVPNDAQELAKRCEEILALQSTALMSRLEHINCKSAVIGISGGLDSTVALLVTILAFDKLGLKRSDIHCITMPGLGTTKRTHDNAQELMTALGVSSREISIVEAVSQHFKDINHPSEKHDAVYENSQARERTQILMDIANQTGGIVIGTGDMSELALGWCTYNGDHMSMYGVNAGVPKTMMQALVKYASQNAFSDCQKVLQDILDTPISPELTPAAEDGSIAQKTEDLVGPYELHDFFLYNMMRKKLQPSETLDIATRAFSGKYNRNEIKSWLIIFIKRFFSQQFKRSCSPDGPKVGSLCITGKHWEMPSDASPAIWLADLD